MMNKRKIVKRAHAKGITMRLQAVILIGLLCACCSSAFLLNNELPCDFFDSINITDGILYSNNSIIFDDIEFPLGQYVKLDHTLANGIVPVTVTPYTRGCICNRMPCIRLCCPHGSIQVKFGECQPNNAARRLRVFGETYRNKTVTSVAYNNYFAFVDGYPCKRLYPIDDLYLISPQGQVQLDDRFIEQSKYCIAVNWNETIDDIELQLSVCNDHISRHDALPICMLFSVFFIIVTLIILGCITKLHNLNGKCLICYLATLALGYTLLSGVQLNGPNYVQPLLCDSAGYLVYFILLSAFLWLSVINFDLWLSFQSIGAFKRLPEQWQFFWYIIYCYGVPSVFTFVVVIIDFIESVPKELRPAVGTTNCFLYGAFVPQLLFFYLPVSIIIGLNIVLFIALVMQLYQSRQRGSQMRHSHENMSETQNTFNCKRTDDVRLYLLLFLVAGVAWILEIISFLTPPDTIIYLIIDIWYCLQGILIFILLVLRRPVVQLIKERWKSCPEQNNSFENLSTADYKPSTSYLRMSTILDDAFSDD